LENFSKNPFSGNIFQDLAIWVKGVNCVYFRSPLETFCFTGLLNGQGRYLKAIDDFSSSVHHIQAIFSTLIA